MITARHFRLSTTILLAISAGFASLTGCGKKADTAPAPEPRSEAPAPEAPETARDAAAEADEPLPEGGIFADIAAANFVALHALQREYEAGGETTAAVDEAFAARWKSIAEKVKPKTLVPNLEFLDIATRVSGKEEYTYSILFRPTADLDTNYHLAFDGSVLPSNARFLEGKHQERAMVKFRRRMDDHPTSTWKKGRYYVVEAKSEFPLIPYNLLMMAFSPTEEEFWTQVGERLSLGWQWAAADEDAFLAKVEACASPLALYEIAPPGPVLTERLRKAIDARWAALSAGMTSQKLHDGLELLALETKATGAKEYTFSFLIRSTRDISTEYILTVLGRVDAGHVQHIKPQEPGATHTSWYINLRHDPTFTWKAGEYHVAPLTIETEIIPYNISVWASPRGEGTRWDWDRKGPIIDLGWQADVRE
ncbi:MAG: hypothetical protein KF886_01405 [Candidatus Hydrogenedentes bacterium]|nr:hypothetical protein [Candidatus Hydrogenedentota bacterium]